MPHTSVFPDDLPDEVMDDLTDEAVSDRSGQYSTERNVDRSWPRGTSRIRYGGDYNPEQWSPEVWREDIR